MNIEIARNLGEITGVKDAEFFRRDTECFEETSNPFGVDSESVIHEAWHEGYENCFESWK